MKIFSKALCVALALMMVISCFAACGGNSNDTTLPKANEGTNSEDGRNAVKDTVPTDLKFNGETVTFFVRDDNELWKNEIDVEKTTNNTLANAIQIKRSFD